MAGASSINSGLIFQISLCFHLASSYFACAVFYNYLKYAFEAGRFKPILILL